MGRLTSLCLLQVSPEGLQLQGGDVADADAQGAKAAGAANPACSGRHVGRQDAEE